MHWQAIRIVVWLISCVLVVAACASSGPIEEAAVVAETTVTPAPTATPLATSTPQPTAIAEALAPAAAVRSTYGGDASQFGGLLVPGSATAESLAPVVVLIHGGFWRQQFGLSLMDPLAADLVERGYATWNIEYRRVGGNGGWPETGDDVAAAIDHLGELAIEHAIDLDRVVLVGHSAGGHLALWALGEPTTVEPTAAIGLGAVVDLAYFREAQGLLGGTIDELPESYADAAPVLDPARVTLVQGGSDNIVPLDSLKVAIDAGVAVDVIDGDDHFDVIDPASSSWEATVNAIASYLVSD